MQPQTPEADGFVDYYRVLELSQPSENATETVTKDVLKNAYHRALLLNHPDKASQNELDPRVTQNMASSSRRHTIDEVVQAYNVLADPTLRKEHDRELLVRRGRQRSIETDISDKGTHSGVEVYDLDDLSHDEEGERWSKTCRCGDEQGYVLTELELENESNEGEIFVGCRGCSLFIKVLFSLVEDGEMTASDM